MLFENFEFLQPKNVLKVCTFVPTLGTIYLVSLLCFRTHFFDFGPVFGCHSPNLEKNHIHILKENLMLDILKKKKKKSSQNLQEQKSSPDPENFR